MKRLPVIPTILVGFVCITMIALGIWQIHAAKNKAELKAMYARNAANPTVTAFPVYDTIRPELLFRKADANCLKVTDWEARAGEDVNGKVGYRHIATCATGVEGPGFAVDMGVSDSFETPKGFEGGEISGTIVPGISSASVIQKLLGKAPPVPPMLVASTPAPGLHQSKVPTAQEIRDPHLMYAVQWFIFSALAVIIYALALRMRWKRGLPQK